MTATDRTDIFNSAIEQHSGAMLHYLYSLCNDWQIAEDLSQDLWKAVHRSFKTEDIEKKTFLYRKAKQVFIDYYRRIKCRVDLDYTEEIPEPILMPTRSEPENTEEDRLLFARFWEMFYPDEYDETSKLIFWLHERYGYTMKEVCQITGIAKSTAHDKLTKLKEACKRRLERNNEQEVNHA